MSKPLHLQVVSRAREIIGDPKRWTKDERAVFENGTSAHPTDTGAHRFCAVGALQRAAHELSGGSEPTTALAHHIQDTIESFAKTQRDPSREFSLENLNDDKDGYAAVLKLFDDYLACSREF